MVTPVTIAIATATPTSITCSSARCPITGRLAMMKRIVSKRDPSRLAHVPIVHDQSNPLVPR